MKNTFILLLLLCCIKINAQDDSKGLFTTYYNIKSIETQGFLDKNGEKSGLWKEFYKSGDLHAVKNYEAGLLNGNFLILNKEADTIQTAGYEKGKLHGKLTEYAGKNIKTEERNYANGKLDGQQIIYYKDGTVNERIHWKEGKLNGKLETFYPDGKPLAVQQYDMDKPTGDFIIYEKNGVAKIQESFGTGRTNDGVLSKSSSTF